jgi:dihydrofolate reductase
MGSIKSGLFISLDGVIESPETWHFDYWNDEMEAAVGALMEGNDAMLLGRKTYDGFAEYWPQADPADPMTAQMNGSRKYVVSNTLTEATWENSTIVSGDVKARAALRHALHDRRGAHGLRAGHQLIRAGG